MSGTESIRGRIALGVAHCAGMVDLVAPPIWVGALVGNYHFDPQQAGLLVTLFLSGAVVSSMIIAPLFHRLRSGRWIAAAAFASASLAFFALSLTADFLVMAGLHVAGGLAIGAALSVKDGTIARSSNPHRLFAICGAALGAFALAFLSTVPTAMAHFGGPVLFQIFSIIMIIGAVTSLLAFPAVSRAEAATAPVAPGKKSPSRLLWAGVIGLCSMSVVHALAFSFLQQMGVDRGFGPANVSGVLVAVGIVNLFPTALAALLQKRVVAKYAMITGVILQATVVVTMFNASSFWIYAIAGSTFTATILFTHVFGFGVLARLDTSGRVLAATPAMIMSGAAVGPLLGGSLVKFASYPALGIAALCFAAVALVCFAQLPRFKADQAIGAGSH